MDEPHPPVDTAAAASGEADDLLSALEVIEGQPLPERADAYEALYDTLAKRLESGPTDARP